MAIGVFELIVLGGLVVIPLTLVVIGLVVFLTLRRDSHRRFTMPRHCPQCGTPWTSADAVCPECGFTLDPS